MEPMTTALWHTPLVFAFAFGAYEVPLLLGAHAPQALAVLAWQAQVDADLATRPEAMAMAVIDDPAAPGWTSANKFVPGAVPSLTQSSWPLAASLALK